MGPGEHGGSWCMVGPGAARWVLERHGGFWKGMVGSGEARWVLEGHGGFWSGTLSPGA